VRYVIDLCARASLLPATPNRGTCALTARICDVPNSLLTIHQPSAPARLLAEPLNQIVPIAFAIEPN
jgi:hypothetical protein